MLLPAVEQRRATRARLRGTALILVLGSLVSAKLTVRAGEARRDVGRPALPVRGKPLDGDVMPASPGFLALADSLSRSVERLAGIPSILPMTGRLSSRYSRERLHPILHITRPHEGIDIAAPMGAPVIAPAAGVVVTVASRPGYGLMVEIDHGQGLMTMYGHLSRVHVREGQSVNRGQLLADVGNSGLSTGPHLHYEIRVGTRPVDPLGFAP
jgi:murein DD-endopeptidase MepM/ murein hydrolase activator NlpD